MQLAEILSDLVSLRVCVRFPLAHIRFHTQTTPSLIERKQDPTAALSLVTASKPKAASTKPTSATDDQTAKELGDEEEDIDLRRAKELVELHYAVKEGHRRGDLGRGLREAREGVARAVGGV
jgi:hypothetical protein